MKILLLTLFVTLTALTSFADEYSSVEEQALGILLAVNPTATANGGHEEDTFGVKVSKIMATIMLSQFDKKGNGALSTITNKCNLGKSVEVTCQLIVLNEDMKFNLKTGSYIKPNNSTESGLIIDYAVNVKTKKIIGSVKYSFAG